MIDSEALTRSTGDICKLKILQPLDIFNQLNKNTIRLANFLFGIGSSILIRSINLDSLLRLVTFYLVPINIPFLLYLANIDKLGVFFNNFTNKVTQLQI